MKRLWDFPLKYAFWFSCLVILCLYLGEYNTGEIWMAELAFAVFFIATMRLAMHPMWKKENSGE